MGERLRILLSGMVAGDPHQGGATWAVLQYFYGLRDLGHDVALVEPLRAEPDATTEPVVRSYFDSLGLPGERSALLWPDSEKTIGMRYEEIASFADGADLLLNISGLLVDERILERIPARAFLDLDPGFNQVWHLSGEDMGFDRHTHFVTVGQLVGSSRSSVPSCGREWITTLPPVVLDHWPAQGAPPTDAFTSVGHWRSYGSMEHDGIIYGQRAHALRELIELPRLVDAPLELALGIHSDEVSDLDALRANEWRLADPHLKAGTPDRYAGYIRQSAGELGIAKSGYVNSRSGWFSDRSACYLASGRPVVAQETGFGEVLPVGEGLLSFRTTADAAAAIEAVRAQPEMHRRRARELAEDAFDARKVLSRLLVKLASSPPPPSPSSATPT
jgi:hypothetical protein